MRNKSIAGIGIMLCAVSLFLLLATIYLRISADRISYPVMFMFMVCYVMALAAGHKLIAESGGEHLRFRRMDKGFLVLLWVYYMIFLLCIHLQPESFYSRGFPNNMNLIPFSQISEYLAAIFDQTMNRLMIVNNLLGMLALYMPIGVLSAVTFPRIRGRRVFAGFVLLLVLMETLQLVTNSGVFDIDDILLGIAGLYIGKAIAGRERINARISIIFEFTNCPAVGKECRQE